MEPPGLIFREQNQSLVFQIEITAAIKKTGNTLQNTKFTWKEEKIADIYNLKETDTVVYL